MLSNFVVGPWTWNLSRRLLAQSPEHSGPEAAPGEASLVATYSHAPCKSQLGWPLRAFWHRVQSVPQLKVSLDSESTPFKGQA